MENILGNYYKRSEQLKKISHNNLKNIENNKLFTEPMSSISNSNFSVNNNLTKQLPIFFIIGHTAMQINVQKKKDKKFSILKESYFNVPVLQNSNINEQKFVVNPTPPSTWGWIQDVDEYQEIQEIKNNISYFDFIIINYEISVENDFSKYLTNMIKKIKLLIERKKENFLSLKNIEENELNLKFLESLKKSFNSSKDISFDKWKLLKKKKIMDNLIKKENKLKDHIFNSNYSLLINKLFGYGNNNNRLNLLKYNLYGIKYYPSENKFRCVLKNCSHLKCQDIEFTNNTGKSCKIRYGRVVEPEQIKKTSLPLYNSSYCLPGSLCIEKAHEFWGTPLLGEGFGIVKLISDKLPDANDSSIEKYNQNTEISECVYSLIKEAYEESFNNRNNPEWINITNKTDKWPLDNSIEEIRLKDNVINHGIISRSSNTDCKNNKQSNIYYLTNDRNLEGKQNISDKDLRLIKLLNLSLTEKKSAFELFKEDQNMTENQDLKSKWNNLNESDRYIYHTKAMNKQQKGLIYLSDLVKEGPAGIYVAYGCSVLDIQYKHPNGKLIELEHNVKGGTYTELYNIITKNLNILNHNLNEDWNIFCDKIKFQTILENNINVPIIAYDDDDSEDFSMINNEFSKKNGPLTRRNTGALKSHNLSKSKIKGLSKKQKIKQFVRPYKNGLIESNNITNINNNKINYNKMQKILNNNINRISKRKNKNNKIQKMLNNSLKQISNKYKKNVSVNFNIE